MNAQDYPVAHFQQMGSLAEALRKLPAQIHAHEYSYESFGSWTLVVQYKGIRFRMVFSGRDPV